MELMRYYNNGFSVFAHIAYYFEKPVGFLRSKHGGRLVQNEYVCASVQNLNYFKSLLFGYGHIIYLFHGIYIKSVLITNFLYFFGGFLNAVFSLLV